MKDAVLTIRLPSDLRSRLEGLARREGRSLSQQVGRLIDQGIGEDVERSAPARRQRAPRPLSGLFQGGQVPTLADLRRVRAMISTSLAGSKRALAPTRR